MWSRVTKGAPVQWLNLGTEVDLDRRDHEYPPNRAFRQYVGISFTLTFVLLAVLATVADYLRVGSPETGIPYNYPLLAGFLYIVAVLFVLRRFHGIFNETKLELMQILERSSASEALFGRDSDVSPEQINREVNYAMSLAFSPGAILLGGFVGGMFTLVVMAWLDTFQYFPYLLLNYAYGAGHGFFYGPIIGSVYLILRISSVYIVDIDVLAPDGVGGYGDIGAAIITLIVYGIALVTLDFVILSSVSFVDEPTFQTAVFALYVLMLLFLLALTVLGVLLMRRRLLAIREQKTDKMRAEFKAIEQRYWEKLDEKEHPEPESSHIQTMETMYDRLQSMRLWPIDLVSLARLIASAGSSAAIALYQAGYVTIPV